MMKGRNGVTTRDSYKRRSSRRSNTGDLQLQGSETGTWEREQIYTSEGCNTKLMVDIYLLRGPR